MALYYLPVLIRSDRYFVARLEDKYLRPVGDNPEKQEDMNRFVPLEESTISIQQEMNSDGQIHADFNFVIPAEDRVLTPILTIEDPERISLNQMAPSERQDIPLSECSISLRKSTNGFELVIRRSSSFEVQPFFDKESGLRLDYSADSKRVLLGFYKYAVEPCTFPVSIVLEMDENEKYYGTFLFSVEHSKKCQRIVIDFGSEASQIGYKNCGPQSSVLHYDILENIISRLNMNNDVPNWRRDDFLNNEEGQSMLYRTFYAVKKKIGKEQRQNFPFNFSGNIAEDEIRLFITRQEVSATRFDFREDYEIIPNLKLGIEKSLQLIVDDQTEDYSIRSHKKELISAVLLRLLRLMISTKPDFQNGGIIVTLLVPNIYTQHDVFEMLNELRNQTDSLLQSLNIRTEKLKIEYETISESDAAFMGYQQTHSSDVQLSNGEMALVIDCGKGTTDISMVIADDNENYSSFFRTGFAGAGNVLLYGFAEDFLTLVLKAIPGDNNISVKDFIRKQVRDQNLTADVLDFIQLMEDQKKKFKKLQPVSITEFAQLSEQSESTERTIGNLYRDQSVLLRYAFEILNNRSVRWDEEVTGLIRKATECIAGSITGSIRDVITRDIRKRIKVVMLSGRAFYFEELRTTLEKELKNLLGPELRINTVPHGRVINNKNVAIHGAFSGAYKITDFTGIPIDKKEGLSKNSDVLNNSMFLYRGIKIEPGNDILYNTSLVRRNHLALKPFKNKTVDIYFTRDNIYLRLMENQQVKEVRSLSSILTTVAENHSPAHDLKAISMFPGHNGELASISELYPEIAAERNLQNVKKQKKKQGVLSFFSFTFNSVT
ncbi:MAG TPA: hypothetical protein PKC72_10265 [Chitinophagaceae bacterium]|nr:hypothetical protein [Chitinophagaceae bacterium]